MSSWHRGDIVSWPPGGTTVTGGWVNSYWRQTGAYDNFCPIEPMYSNRCVVGCTATATSQIMNYHKYIGNRVWTTINDGYISKEGTGYEIEIDQDAELCDFPKFETSWGEYESLNTYLNSLRGYFNSGISVNVSEHPDEVAAFCFTAGVACEMNYGPVPLGSSGSADNEYFTEKFEYDYAEKYPTWIQNNFKITNLIIDMKNALPAEVIINTSTSLHAIICDGYKISDEYEDFFHFNYGWGYTNPVTITEAWYNLPELTSSHTLNACVAHICPPGFNGSISGNISLIGGNGNVEDVVVTVGFKETNPDVNGDYVVEIYNGNYSVSAYLNGYSESFYFADVIEVLAGQTTSNINLTLNEYVANTLIVPTNYSTIQDAIDAASDGDIVIVHPSTYYENINFNGKKILVTSLFHYNQDEYYIENTIISGLNVADESKVVLFNHGEDENSILNGFTITEGNTTGPSNGSGIECYGSSPLLKNLIITNNTGHHGSAIYLRYANPDIRNTKIYSNHLTWNDGSVIAINHAVDEVNMENVNIYSNNHTGIRVSQSTVNMLNSNIYNNILTAADLWKSVLNCSNCLFWDNNSGGNQLLIEEEPSELTINYSDIQGGLPAGATGSNNINVAPNLYALTFQPKWTATEFSPLIDSGDPSIIDPDDTPSDIGAVRAMNHKVDSIELIEMTEGINWKCLPVLDDVFTGNDIASYLFFDIQQIPYPALDLVEMQNPDFNIYHDGNIWQNNSQQFISEKGCKIHMNDPYTLKITVFLEDPYHVIELEAEIDNWIGYYPEASMKPLDAFEAVLDDIDMIQTKTFTLNKTELGWLGASNWTLNYSDLVVVHCTNNCSFYWGEDGGGSVPKDSRSSSQDFTYNEEADYLSVYVELDNQALGNPTEIGIFIENECKGAEVIIDSLVQIRTYVMNDSVAFDPGLVEFQLSFGSRSANTKINNYKIKKDLNDSGETGPLDFTSNPQPYYLISLTDSGNSTPEVLRTSLDQNYPNPFNPTTTINFSIAEVGNVELVVYNIKGQKVKTLINENKESGQYQVIWDGSDDTKKQVSSGIYFYNLIACKKVLNKKMLLLK